MCSLWKTEIRAHGAAFSSPRAVEVLQPEFCGNSCGSSCGCRKFFWLDIWNFFKETQGGLCLEVHEGRVGRCQGGSGSESKTEVSAHECVRVLFLGIGE